MKSGHTLSYAIGAILGIQEFGIAFAANSTDSADPSRGEIQEIVVTATRRSENSQDVPITITALTAETLSELHAQTFLDYVAYLPNVSSAAKGPGQGEVYMRGLSTTQAGSQTAGAVGSFPNVAIYLDDQSAQLPGRNLDIYAADLERIEVLEGPQGTLFGAGAQAGVIRYITNKPKINRTEGGADASYSTTAHGDPSTAVSAFINIPLIADHLAARLVVYDDARGGYINNVPGTFARSSTDKGVVSYFGGVVPANSAVITNSNLVGRGINPAVYKGTRGSALYEFNDNWNVLLQQSYQSLDADGVFAYNPALGDLNVQQYNPSGSRDQFEDTALTVNGQIDALKIVYAGAYLDRNINQKTDYTAYARGAYAVYYQCNGPAFARGTGTTNVCYSPSSIWTTLQQNTHLSHELRVSTPDDWRLRGIGGLYHEAFTIREHGGFYYGSPAAGFTGQLPLAGTTATDPTRRPDGDVFFSDVERGYKQDAIFGEVTYDFIPKTLSLSLGSRFYNIRTFEVGSVNPGYGCRFIVNCTDNPLAKNLNADNLFKTYVGHADKVNLSWKATDTALVYLTYSVGFRPGGFNLGQGVVSPTSPIYGKFTLPLSFGPDTLKNYELGWKTDWLDRRLQINGTIYEEKWQNVQLTTFDPALYGNIIFSGNGPNYRVRGLEGDLIAKLMDGLTLTSSFAWNHSEQVSSPSVNVVGGAPIPIFPTAGLGSPLAQSPPFAGNIRARYEFPLLTYQAYVQIGAQHQAHSYASVATQYAFEPPNYEQAPWTTYDASLGTSKDNWTVELFGQNLTDTRAQLYVNGFDYVRLVTPNRPRVIGLHVSYRFNPAKE